MKKIGIIGSGAVAKALGNGFIKHGYEVRLGTRDKTKLADWLAQAGDKASVGTFSEAAFFGDIVVLAVKGHAVKDALALAEQKHLDGKTIIDTCNPIAGPPVNGVLPYFTAANTSLMEELQKLYPDAHFVKCFNSVGSPVMVNPEYLSGKPSMFICGNSEGAKAEVTEILGYFGYEPEDMGTAEAARAIEALCMLWCIPGFRENSWTHALKLLRK